MTARIGSETAMLAHIEQYAGIRHVPYEASPKRRPSTTRWTERRWSLWGGGASPRRHGKVMKGPVL